MPKLGIWKQNPPRYGTVPRGSMRSTTFVRHFPENESAAAANPNRAHGNGVGLLAHDHSLTPISLLKTLPISFALFFG